MEAGGAYADRALEAEMAGLSDADRALATELVYGVLRWQIKIDWIINAFSRIRTARLEHRVLNALRLGVYQLLFLSGIPARAAVSETVELVGNDGPRTRGFVNAVLRKIDARRDAIAFPLLRRDPVGYISVVFSHPRWIVRRWIDRYGAAAAMRLCQAGLAHPPRTIRVNTMVTTREALARELTAMGYAVEEGRFSPQALIVSGGPAALAPRERRYYMQDEASQLVALLAAPPPGGLVLDGCAAPGGKTTHLAQLMDGTGTVVAVDTSESRLEAVREAARLLSLENIVTVCADAAGDIELPGGTEEFDCVLVDAPCTGLGVLRRAPDIKLRRREEDLAGRAALQLRLISNLARRVRPGGVLVYAVCSFEPEETTDVVERFLDDNSEFTVEDAAGVLPPACAEVVDRSGFLGTRPDLHGIDGFFGARLRRRQ